jgi:hypothetical protein
VPGSVMYTGICTDTFCCCVLCLYNMPLTWIHDLEKLASQLGLPVDRTMNDLRRCVKELLKRATLSMPVWLFLFSSLRVVTEWW